jgi:hypothetical protein
VSPACVLLVLSLAAARPPSIAILDLKTSGTFDPSEVSGLSGLIATEVARRPLRAFAGADLKALIGYERKKQLLGCYDDSCLSEIGGALGVDYLLSSEVSQVGEVWLLSFVLLDARAARAVSRTTHKAQALSDLVDLVPSGVAEALAPAFAKRPGDAPAAKVGATASPGKVAGYVLDAGGAALLAGGAAFGIWAELTFQDAKKATTAQQMSAFKADTKAHMLAADVLYGVGAAALTVGLVLTFVSGPSKDAPAVGVAPLRSGGAVTVSGGF